MSSKNPFTAAENGEQSGKKQAGQQTSQRSGGSDQPPQQGVQSADLERVEELEEEVEELRERVEEAESPEPDYECANSYCEGFALEEASAENFVTKKYLFGADNLPHVVICPRCGEEMESSDVVPKEEQQAKYSSIPKISSNDNAGREIRDRLNSEDRAEVLEEAESKW